MSSDDSKSSLQSRIARRLFEAQQRETRIAKALANRAAAPIIGDLFAFPDNDKEAETALLWVILRLGTDHLYTVPADINPLAGTGDFCLPVAAACGPLTLRTCLGMWLPIGGLKIGTRTGFIEDLYVVAINRASLLGNADRQIDAAPEYRNWIAAVSRSAEKVRAAVEDCERKE